MNKIYIFVTILAVMLSSVTVAQEKGDTPPVNAPAASPVTGSGSPQMPSALPPGVTPQQVKDFIARQQQQREENYVVLNFDNAELSDVINTISSITGENFIVTSGLNANITIHSSKKIPVSEVLNVFESILEVNGISLVKSGDFYKILLSTATKQKPLQIQKGKDANAVSPIDRPITQIIPVDNVTANEVRAVLMPMLSPYGSMVPNIRNNLLIVNDNASSIRRLLLILNEIDVEIFDDKRMEFYQPKYSDVKSLSDELTNILNALNISAEGVVLVPIERINSLIIFAASVSLLNTVDGWIKKLDEDVTTGQNVFVYPVQNVEAESIASVLNTLFVDTDTKSPVRQASTSTQQKIKANQNKKSKIPAPVRRQTTSGVSSTSSIEITVFEPTNSLVILAPPGIYRDMVGMIKKLDVYPREVLIEVLIVEVSLNHSEQFGIQWSVLDTFSESGKEYSYLTQSRADSVPSFTLPLSITEPSLTAGGFSYLLYNADNLIAMIHALSGKGRVDILSSPRLLVRDQEEASIEVGEDIPTATSSSQAASTTSTLTQTIEYKTIGIKLKIKPSINDEKTVILDIEQEVSDQLPNVTVGQEGFSFPAFSTRKTKTSIIVPDKQGIVIGGIMKEKKDKNYQGIPVLSSLPVLGNLFRYTVEQKSKTELIVLLTPHVITTRTEADMLTLDFLDKFKEIKEVVQEHSYSGSVSSGTPEDQ